ncbi:isochorismate family cysteine hydrolase YcaC [uncultured Pluralibacter sp.]|uniref:isochorismate family cysteine hydrolase YcaC n=1 Tax=uncultured Pluralibacter sp. TaxID=1490864 RepID=UPI002622F9E7|nr:isochorismate family cysteine hydrolase YcaC [uncultured Pluralibacter sp.]
MSKPYVRLDKDDAAVLFVDHQSGLLNMTRDFNPDQLRNRVIGLADLAKFFNLPVILTTSFEDGPNGPIVPELVERFPDAPYIARPGQINAWDNEDFVNAVKATGKKQLIIAGVVTEVCVAFPSLSALAEGYDVFVIADASATFDAISRETALDRIQAAGGQILTWFAAAGELQRDWRNDIQGFAGILGPHIAPYSNLIQSYTRAQEEAKKSK